jgi:Adenylate and Guanylate cyclase catalytic domain
MVASGIPDAGPEHLKKLMRAALDMLSEVAKVRAPNSAATLSIRIGVHAGPVTAGVIGESKFTFDVWGDTVNVASRMESSGVAGQIQVTDAVATALANIYSFDGPEFINIKGKGLTRVWRLNPACGYITGSSRRNSVLAPLMAALLLNNLSIRARKLTPSTFGFDSRHSRFEIRLDRRDVTRFDMSITSSLTSTCGPELPTG